MTIAPSITTLSMRLQQLNASIQNGSAALQDRSASASTAAKSTLSSIKQAVVTNAMAAPAASATVSLSAAGVQMAALPVDYTDKIKKSGDINIDALLAGGSAWWHTPGASGEIPSSTARHVLTFSFMDDASGLNATGANGFQALDADHKQRVRDALGYISSVANLTFTEVASGGDIQYGSNYQTASAGYASYPNQAGAQVMLANNQGTYTSGDTSEGSYTWEVILHETSHALGLKHPGNYNAGGGGTPGPYLPAASDNRGNSIMSYKDASNVKQVMENRSGGFQTSTLNPYTLQADDIAALQYLYGVPAGSSAQTFQWDEGEAMSATIWSDNANSMIDLSNQTANNLVDLRAGKSSSIAVRDAYVDISGGKARYTSLNTVVNGKTVKLSSVLGTPTYTGSNNLKIAAGSHINNAVGGSGNDTFVSNGDGNHIDGADGNDAFFLSGGNDSIAGGAGDDTIYLKTMAGAAWKLSDDLSTATLSKTVTDRLTKVTTTTTLSTVTLSSIEHVSFWGGSALKGAATSLYDQFSGGSGNDTFVGKGDSVMSGGDGTNAYFVGGNATVTGGAGDDTIYLKTVAGAIWKFNDDRSTATLNKTVVDPITKIVTTTTLSTVNMSGIEHIGLWNGSTPVRTAGLYDQFTGNAGNDTFVAQGEGVINGGDGTNAYFVGGNATVTGGAGDDTLYLKTVAGATWKLNDDRSTATLSKTVVDPVTKIASAVTLSTVNMSGIEHIGLWNGSTAKSTGSLFDQFTGTGGNDTFVAKGTSLINATNGTNSFYVSGDSTIAGGTGNDTVYLKAITGAIWTLNADRSAATLTKADPKDSTKTLTLSTVNMTDVEHVAFWNGTTAKPLATPLPLASPVMASLAAHYEVLTAALQNDFRATA